MARSPTTGIRYSIEYADDTQAYGFGEVFSTADTLIALWIVHPHEQYRSLCNWLGIEGDPYTQGVV